MIKIVIAFLLALGLHSQIAGAQPYYGILQSCINGSSSVYPVPTIYYASECSGTVFDGCCFGYGSGTVPTRINNIVADPAAFYVTTKGATIEKAQRELEESSNGNCTTRLSTCQTNLAASEQKSLLCSTTPVTTVKPWKKNVGAVNYEFKSTLALSQVGLKTATEVYQALQGSIGTSPSAEHTDPGIDELPDLDILSMAYSYLLIGFGRPTFMEEYIPYAVAVIRHRTNMKKADLLKMMLPEYSAIVNGSLVFCIYLTLSSLFLLFIGFKLRMISQSLLVTSDKRVKAEDVAIKDLEGRSIAARQQMDGNPQGQMNSMRGFGNAKGNANTAVVPVESEAVTNDKKVVYMKAKSATVMEGDALKALNQLGVMLLLSGMIGTVYSTVQWIAFGLTVEEFPFLDQEITTWMRFLMGDQVSANTIMSYIATIAGFIAMASGGFFAYRAGNKVLEKTEVARDKDVANILNSVRVP